MLIVLQMLMAVVAVLFRAYSQYWRNTFFLKQRKSLLFNFEMLQSLLEPQSLSVSYLSIKNTRIVTMTSNVVLSVRPFLVNF